MKRNKVPPIPDKIVFDMFMRPGYYMLDQWQRWKEPTDFNGNIEVEKYRVTIERVEEPKEVLCERLQTLIDHCDNHHHWEPLKHTAERLGVEVNMDTFGKDRSRHANR